MVGFGPDAARRNSSLFRMRTAAARSHLQSFIGIQTVNGDDALYADYRGSFTKTLPHNAFGEVDPAAYRSLLDALESGDYDDFEAIPLSPEADRKLANPQGAYKYELTGLDSHATWMRPAPAFASAETAAEMGEVYWKALLRDVPFSAFDTDPDVAAAVADLNGFSETVGPREGGAVTTTTVFRGETPGDLVGPYISQFLFKPVPMGNLVVEQRYPTPAPGDDYMTTRAEWLAVQNGVAPPPLVKGNPRYISDARALGEYVHVDFSYQAYLNAALILLGLPGVRDVSNPYNSSATQGGFVSLGGPDVLDLVAKAANLSLTGAWYQKWLVHRRLRPEVYAGRLHFQIEGDRNYGLPAEIVNSEAIARVRSRTGTAFLPMAFPEGSPTHPAYPAGHATIAGACVTVLKAFFEETAELPEPVVASVDGSELLPWTGEALTVGGELNKLANNIALGRDWAGVHYRSDGVDGLLVGEQQALGLLADYTRCYNELFDGFSLTRYDGTAIQIVGGEIIEL
ncbi:vanadium-dependent haloperoxidase [Wenzhouxiangella sp. XN79A]|nr:vanadium-dependent haloperoxidase [Wenzhouxiangella sp. XN79A]